MLSDILFIRFNKKYKVFIHGIMKIINKNSFTINLNTLYKAYLLITIYIIILFS